MKRAQSPFKGCWVCPGGKGLLNETPLETVTREFLEEVNLTFKPQSLYETQLTPESNYFKFLGICKGAIEVQHSEIADYGWFYYHEVLELDLGFDFKGLMQRLHRDQFLW